VTGRRHPDRHPDRHVALIGLPGAGKTSVGRQLAKLLHRPFADADEQLELAAGCTIPRLVREHGEDELRRREDRTLADLLRRDGPLVISAPGAIALSRGNRALLAESAVVLRLHASPTFLRRLGDPTHRPRLGDDQLAALTRLEQELSELYADVADHTVDIEPFHTHVPPGDQPKHAIARHIGRLLGEPVPSPPGDKVGTRAEVLSAMARIERAAAVLYEDVADHTVDVEPFHAGAPPGEEPKRAIARHILHLLTRDT
jgi:shikimate kinase